MQHRRIGSLTVSLVGLGCNNFGRRIDERRTAEVVAAALDSGINFFDTADMYGDTLSEQYLGRALAGRRKDAVIATKFGWELDQHRKGAHPDYVRRAAEDSLSRLGTDHIDLYQLHKPDPTVPIGDTLAALDELVKAGKVREIGCSQFSVAQLQEAEAAVRGGAVRFVSVQNEYSLLKRDPEREMLPACERLGIAFLPFFPLSSGLLSGKYRLGKPPPSGSRITPDGRFSDLLSNEMLRKVEALIAFAERRGRTILELAISWLASRKPVASVIAGATSTEQVRANASAAGWALTPAELAEIDRILAQPA
jgi:aryl-alcohol dehydrogenase-like predicted oxidoreductase